MEYLVNRDTDDLIYVMLVEKDYYHPVGFKCLDTLKTDFNRFFTSDQIANSKELSLSNDFQGTFERIWVYLYMNSGRI